jgi:hypothetical protein
MFGNWSIESELYQWLVDNLEENKLLIEMGSGNTTSELIKKWNVISIEEDIYWVNKFHENYIHAPIINGWYDFDVIKNQLPAKIDALLVDGPAHGERMDLVDKIEFFMEKSPEIIVFDDTKRLEDYDCFIGCLRFLESHPDKYEVSVETINTSKGVSCIKIKYLL